jgi:hypothetical protein
MTNYDNNCVSLNKITDMNKFHKILNHCGADRLDKTAHIYGIKLRGNVEVCEDCAIAKARKKNVNNKWKGGIQVPGKKLYMDINAVRDLNLGGSKFWILIIDECTIIVEVSF